MICKNCGTPLEDGALFCGECGTKTEIENSGTYCKNCGTEVFEDDSFCPSCGKKVDEFGNIRPPVTNNTVPNYYNNAPYNMGGGYNPPQKKDNSGIGILIAVLASVFIVLAAVVIILGMINGKGNNAAPVVTPTPVPTQTPTQAPTQQPVLPPLPPENVGRNEYLFNTHTTYITEAYLDLCSQDEVRLILNEMYARHGYIFKDAYYRQYFGGKDWYVPRYSSQSDAQKFFNSYEEANRIFIIDYEQRMGWR